MKRILLIGIITFFALLSASCNGGSYGIVQPNPEDLCKCLPVEPDILDFRHIAKHVPIPAIAAQEIGVDTILSWTQDAFVAPDAPRTGRELQVFHVATAFLQEASVNSADCDVHFEISMTADKNAPRVIVETIVDSEFCSARQAAQSQLKKHGFTLDSSHGGELPQALPIAVLGMAFEDFDHSRGSVDVATNWELHPAIVTIPQNLHPRVQPQKPRTSAICSFSRLAPPAALTALQAFAKIPAHRHPGSPSTKLKEAQ